MDAPVRSNSLTAYLARAADDRPDRHSVGTADPAYGANPDGDAAAPPIVAADGERCTASVISGQQCRRIAPEGQELCEGHLAMAAKTGSVKRERPLKVQH